MSTGGTNAAATLSVAVSTKEAVDNLQLLSTKLKEVREAAGVPVSSKGIKDIGGTSKEAAAELKALQRDVDELKAKLVALSVGAGGVGKSLKTSMSAGGAGFGGLFKLSDTQVEAFNARLKSVGLEASKAMQQGWTNANWNATNQVLVAFRKNTESELNKVVRMTADARKMVADFGPETAANKFGSLIVSGDAEKQAEGRLATIRAYAKQESDIAVERKRLQSAIAENEKRAHAEFKQRVSEKAAQDARDLAAWRARAKEQEAGVKSTATRAERLDTQRFQSTLGAAQISESAQGYTAAGKQIYAAKVAVEQYGEAATRAFLGPKAYLVDNISSIGNYTASVKKAAQSVDGLTAAESRRAKASAEKVYGNFVHASPTAQRAIVGKVQSAALLDAETALNRYGAGIVGLIPRVNELQAAQKPLAQAHTKVTSAVQAHTAAQQKWNSTQNETHSLIRGISGSLGQLWMTYGQLAPLMAGAALGAGFKAVAQSGAEFAYQLKFVQALSSESAASMYNLNKAALDLARNSLQGPTEIANGFRMLAQAGLGASDAIKAMPEVLHLATVGEMDMAQAATTLVGVMNAFGLSVESAGHVGDVFAKAAAMSQTSVQQMTEAMKTASVAHDQYGASLEGTAAAITLLAKVNITGTAAGTAYRNMLKELYTPGDQASKVLKNLGVSTQDSSGRMKEFSEIVFDIKDKLVSFKQGDQAIILQKLFGERGSKAVIQMMAQTRDEYNKFERDLANSSGFMGTVYKQLEETTKGGWQKALNNLKAQFVVTFQELEPLFANIATSLQGMFADDGFKQGLKDTVSLMGTLVGALASLSPALIDGAKLWLAYKAAMFAGGAWAAASVAVTTFANSMLAASGVMGPALSKMAAAKGVVAGLPSLFLALPAPVSIAVGAIAGLGTAMYLFRDKTAEAMDSAGKKVAEFGNLTSQILADVMKNIGKVGYTASLAAVEKAREGAKAQMSGLSTMQDEIKKKFGVSDVATMRKELEAFDKARSTDIRGNAMSASSDALSNAGTARIKSMRSYVKAFEEASGTLSTFDEAEARLRDQQQREEDFKPTVKSGNRSASEVLTKEPSGAGAGAARAVAKDARKILEDNLSSALKQEQTQLAREQLDIEIELAAQQLNSIQATEKKNAATKASLEVERLWIQASLDDAKATGDKVTISKFENDLLENSEKLRKQAQQTLLDDTRARTANRVSIEDTNVALARSLEDMRAEQKELGLTASQVRLLRIERERARAERDLQIKFDRNEITPEQFDAQKNANNMQAEEKRNQEDYQRSFVSGWDKAYKDYQDSATNAAQNAATAFNSVMKGMEDALTDFVTTGKTSFSDLVNSILTDLARLVVRQSVTGPLSQALGSVVSGMFGGTGGGATPATTWVAKGGVFTSPSLSAYSNGVYDSPRTFAFAQGGVFAEAGPEAIMPLTRTSSGDLGVRSQSSAPVININVKNEAGADGYSATATARNNDGKIDIDVLVTRAIRNDMKKNGPITQGLLGLTGTRRSAA